MFVHDVNCFSLFLVDYRCVPAAFKLEERKCMRMGPSAVGPVACCRTWIKPTSVILPTAHVQVLRR